MVFLYQKLDFKYEFNKCKDTEIKPISLLWESMECMNIIKIYLKNKK